MQSAIYRGEDSRLRGLTALIRPKTENMVLAQFDIPQNAPSLSAASEGDLAERYPECFGWHEFLKVDFEVLQQSEVVV